MVFWSVFVFLALLSGCGLIRVRTGSRLHFGLLNLPSHDDEEDREPTSTGSKDRQFGGVGMMVTEPGISLVVQPAAAWRAEGPLADRALAFARQVQKALPGTPIPPQHLVIESCAREHAGLGTGTQLGLAIAGALGRLAGMDHLPAEELAGLVGRGVRSALGIHGFAQGGFLVEAGKRRPRDISPLVARFAVPESWRMVVLVPADAKGLHGVHERNAFRRLEACKQARTSVNALCRLIVLELLPALADQDLKEFGRALYEFNLRVGRIFALVQGGTYSHPHTQEIVSFIRKQDVPGTGQSSWGPSVFAVVEDLPKALWLRARLQSRFGLVASEIILSSPANHGADIEVS
ncbi:MAG TPA: hypothetical protein VG099_22860 [Gemmataceae bacterium]|nr:hypothetical protein [Gemmataceae bacterium]